MTILDKVIEPKQGRIDRTEICRRCEHLKGVLLLRCAVCGCLIKTKVTVAASSCPKGKW